MTIAIRAAACLASLSLMLGACDDPHALADLQPTKSYYMANTAMEPNLPANATINAKLIEAIKVKRGDLLIIRSDKSEDYIKRLIGVPGDIIALSGGIVVLNGERLNQRVIGDYRYMDGLDANAREAKATRLRESLPDGPSYDILDQGESFGDNLGEVHLGEDEYFVLGDNRDNSADSRFPSEVRGLGIVSGAQIKRRVDISSIER